MDETGVFLARPSHVYCEKSQKIIKSLFKDSKKRFTVALTVSSTGEFLPLLFILGSNAKRMKIYFEEFQKKNGKITLDQFIGKLLKGDIKMQ